MARPDLLEIGRELLRRRGERVEGMARLEIATAISVRLEH